MRKITIILIFYLLSPPFSFGQVKLTYKHHALKAGDVHTTQEVGYIDEGKPGPKQIWDFSKMSCSITKTSELLETAKTSNGDSQDNTNIAIKEKDNLFYFKVDDGGIKYYGLITPNSVIKFHQPIVKMVYPFSYKDHQEGSFTGTGLYYGRVESQITGSYTVEADGYGKLLLPDNVTLNNVLRVKTTEKITEETCKSVETETIKYLWFIEDSRYPVMVVLSTHETTSDGNERLIKSGYYNYQALSRKSVQNALAISEITDENFAFTVFPNPFKEYFNLKYSLKKTCSVSIEIYDVSGMKVRDLVINQQQQGEHALSFTTSELGLATGSYFIQMIIDKKPYMKKIVIIN